MSILSYRPFEDVSVFYQTLFLKASLTIYFKLKEYMLSDYRSTFHGRQKVTSIIIIYWYLEVPDRDRTSIVLSSICAHTTVHLGEMP